MNGFDDWPYEQREAFLDHLMTNEGSAALVESVATGGIVRTYADQWMTARTAAVEADERSGRETAALALTLPVPDWGTVRDYLVELLAAFWGTPTTYREATSGYGMTGESDWRYDLYRPLAAAGLIPSWREGYGVGHRLDGTHRPEDRDRANAIILAAIRLLASEGDS